jgi:hypothetical protein
MSARLLVCGAVSLCLCVVCFRLASPPPPFPHPARRGRGWRTGAVVCAVSPSECDVYDFAQLRRSFSLLGIQ